VFEGYETFDDADKDEARRRSVVHDQQRIVAKRITNVDQKFSTYLSSCHTTDANVTAGSLHCVFKMCY